MGAYKIGDTVFYNGKKHIILNKRSGGKTKEPVMQSGVMQVGNKSKPCTYLIAKNLWVRGDKLKRH